MNQESKAITSQQTFEDNITNRLREDIGRLLPDEKLRELIERGIEDLFFKDRTIKGHYRDEHDPSWFKVELQRLLRDEIRAAAKSYIHENRDVLKASVVAALQENFFDFLAEAVLDIFSGGMFQAQNGLSDRIRESMVRAGVAV